MMTVHFWKRFRSFSRPLFAPLFTATSNVPDAIAALQFDGPFDLVISDYQLHPHTALDIAHYMRTHHIPTPLILHSGYGQIDESLIKNQNYLGLVEKPNIRGLIAILREKFPLLAPI